MLNRVAIGLMAAFRAQGLYRGIPWTGWLTENSANQ
jgi:hypothetical protein